MSVPSMRQLSPVLGSPEPLARFLQGGLLWITGYEELVDASCQHFMPISSRKLGQRNTPSLVEPDTHTAK